MPAGMQWGALEQLIDEDRKPTADDVLNKGTVLIAFMSRKLTKGAEELGSQGARDICNYTGSTEMGELDRYAICVSTD